VLYHSRFAGPWEEAGLRALLERLRAHNAARDLTGLLLCSDDRFVQVLEGPEAAVCALYARIRRDPRHRDVATLREGLGPRRFAGWAMGFGYVPGPDLHSGRPRRAGRERPAAAGAARRLGVRAPEMPHGLFPRRKHPRCFLAHRKFRAGRLVVHFNGTFEQRNVHSCSNLPCTNEGTTNQVGTACCFRGPPAGFFDGRPGAIASVPTGVRRCRGDAQLPKRYPQALDELRFNGTEPGFVSEHAAGDDEIASLYLKLLIDRQGRVSDVQITRPQLSNRCGREVRAKLVAMTGWTPARRQGQPVCCWLSLPVSCLKWQ
jgi:hypothetical protein